MLKMGAAAAVGTVAATTPFVSISTQAKSSMQAKSLLTRMNGENPDWQPDPMNPGGPMIPPRWDSPPFTSWTLPRVREFTPTATIRRDPGRVLPLRERLRDIDGIEFEANGRRSTIREWLDSSFTHGFLVLHRSKVIAEEYMNGMAPHQPHLGFSMSKSFTGTLLGIVAHKGLIDTESLVTRYLPELEETAYRGATVQHVLDMTGGMKFDENDSQAWDPIYAAIGWDPLQYCEHPDYPKNTWEVLLGLTEQDAPHGERFDYRSPENFVLGFIIQRVTGKMLPELFSSELWAPMGAEEDADITVDRARFAESEAGFNATLRDYARFALLHLRNGKLNGKQIIPSEWIEKTRRPDPYLFQIFEPSEDLPKGAYHNTFWIEDAERAAYACRGHNGQQIYIDPESDFAAVKLSHHPEDGKPGRWLEAIEAIHAIRDELTR